MGAELSVPRIWKYRGGQFALGKRTLLMGVVNITPDSFSDGGRFFATEAAAAHVMKLQDDGADLLDIGAESTRPGSVAVTADEQLHRLMPVLEKVIGRTTAPISVDTTSSLVARECIRAGASIVNDITGFHLDPGLPDVCAESGVGVVLMHIKGIPESMQRRPQYNDLFGEIQDYLKQSVTAAERAGISRAHVIVDPGIGFGKTFEHNYQLLGGLSKFQRLGAGVLVGPSRKAFTGEFSRRPPNERQFPTAAAVAIAVMHGADIVRVHDVAEMRQVVDILDRFRAVQEAREHGLTDR